MLLRARFSLFATTLAIAMGCGGASTPAPLPSRTTTPTPHANATPTNATKESSSPIAESPQKKACPAIDFPLPSIAHEDGIDVDVPDLEDASESLAPFYEKLARLLRGRATDHIRIAMYGDSNMTRDFITGHMRRFWQGRLGDAGHGWVSMGRPWEWYRHMDVRHGAFLKSWKHFAVSTAPAADHLIGFAGIAAQSIDPNAVAYVQTADAGAPVGTTASTFEVYWLSRLEAGTFKVVADHQTIDEIDAFGYEPHVEFQRYELGDAPHRFSLVAGVGPVRLFGVTMERMPETGPSVVVDSLGCGAMSAKHMANREDRSLNEAMLAHRKYDLVFELVGSNMFEPKELLDEWATVIGTHRAVRPDVGFVMMSPPDMAQTMASTHSEPRIVKVGKLKREIAAQLGVAFWDFRQAMGGELSIQRFRRHQMAWSDLIHLTEKGAAYMADRIDLALVRGFSRWLEKHPDAGCE